MKSQRESNSALEGVQSNTDTVLPKTNESAVV